MYSPKHCFEGKELWKKDETKTSSFPFKENFQKSLPLCNICNIELLPDEYPKLSLLFLFERKGNYYEDQYLC